MGDTSDEDLLSRAGKLPISERLSHKNWKVRDGLFNYLSEKFTEASSEDRIFAECCGLLPKAVKDANAAAQLAGLGAVQKFAENAPEEMVKGIGAACGKAIAEKTFTGRPMNRKQGIETVLGFVYGEAGEEVVDGLITGGFSSKNPKITAACVSAVTEAITTYGAKSISIPAITKSLPSLLEHSNGDVRSGAKLLTVELHKWVGTSLMTTLKKVKELTLKEIETAVSANTGGPPAPLKLTRSKEVQVEKGPVSGGDDGDGQNLGSDEVEEDLLVLEEIDLRAAIAAIKLDAAEGRPLDLVAGLENTKWATRKAALLALSERIEGRRLKTAEGLDILVPRLRKIFAKDSNIQVVAAAAFVVSGLASGLRDSFPVPAAKALLSSMLAKLKEKHRTVVDALGKALDSTFISRCITFGDVMEEINAALEVKIPNAKIETLKWIHRCLIARASSVADVMKDFCGALTKRCEDSSGDIRDLAIQNLGEVVFRFGEKKTQQHLSKLNKIRSEKIAEYVSERKSKAETATNNAAPAPRNDPAPAQPQKPRQEKQEQVPLKQESTESVPKEEKLEASTQDRKAEVLSAPSSLSIPITTSNAAVNPPEEKPKESVQASGDRENVPAARQNYSNGTEASLDETNEEEVQQASGLLFPGLDLSQLSTKSSAARKVTIEAMRDVCSVKEELTLEQLRTILTLVIGAPGMRDNNFACVNTKIEVVSKVIGVCAKAICGPLVDKVLEEILQKLGDFKSGKIAQSCLLDISLHVHPQHLFNNSKNLIENTTNPRAVGGCCDLLKSAFMRFGAFVDLEAVRDLVTKAAESAAPAIKSSAAGLAAAFDYQSSSDSMKEAIKEDDKLSSSYAAAFAKLDGEVVDAKRWTPSSPDSVQTGCASVEIAVETPVKASPQMQKLAALEESESSSISSTGSIKATRNAAVPIRTPRKESRLNTPDRVPKFGSTPSRSPLPGTNLSARKLQMRSQQIHQGKERVRIAPSPVATPAKLDMEEEEGEADVKPPNALDLVIRSIQGNTTGDVRCEAMLSLEKMLKAGEIPQDKVESLLPVVSTRLLDPIRDVSSVGFRIFAELSSLTADVEEFLPAVFQSLTKNALRESASTCLFAVVSALGATSLFRAVKKSLLEEKAVVKKEVLEWVLEWTRRSTSTVYMEQLRSLSPVLDELTRDKSAGLRLHAKKLTELINKDDSGPKPVRKAPGGDLKTGLRRPAAARPTVKRAVEKPTSKTEPSSNHAPAESVLRKPRGLPRSRLQPPTKTSALAQPQTTPTKPAIAPAHRRQELEKVQQKAEKVLQKPGKVLQKPGKVLQRPEKTLQRPEKTLQRPEKVLQRPARAPQKRGVEDWLETLADPARTSQETGVVLREIAAARDLSAADSRALILTMLDACEGQYGDLELRCVRTTLRLLEREMPLLKILGVSHLRDLLDLLVGRIALAVDPTHPQAYFYQLVLYKIVEGSSKTALVRASLQILHKNAEEASSREMHCVESVLSKALSKDEETNIREVFRDMMPIVESFNDLQEESLAAAVAACVSSLLETAGRDQVLLQLSRESNDMHRVVSKYVDMTKRQPSRELSRELPRSHDRRQSPDVNRSSSRSGVSDSMLAALESPDSTSPFLRGLMAPNKENVQESVPMRQIRGSKIDVGSLRSRFNKLVSEK